MVGVPIDISAVKKRVAAALENEEWVRGIGIALDAGAPVVLVSALIGYGDVARKTLARLVPDAPIKVREIGEVRAR